MSNRNLKLPTQRSGDLAPLAEVQLDSHFRKSLDEFPLDWLDGRCVQGAGTYSANDFTLARRSNVNSLVKTIVFEIWFLNYSSE